jgi:recombination protein RecA
MVARISKSGDRAQEGGNYFAKQQEGVEFFPSGCLNLDLILGGGWAEERHINVIGDNSTGKTLLAIEAATNFMRKYGKKARVRYREREKAFDLSYAKALGMPVDDVDFGDPEEPWRAVEDMYDEIDYRCDKAATNDYHTLFIIDSLDAISSRAELARAIDEGSYGAEKAKMMSQLFRRKTDPMKEARITLWIISQTRDKIGATFGKKYTRSGGNAMDFYCSQIVYLAHVENVWRELGGFKRPVGNHIRARMDKCKVGLPYRQCDFNILFGFGIDDLTACLNWAKAHKIADDIYDHHSVNKSKYSRLVASLDKDEYNKELARVREIVTKRYWEIEKTFLPTRTKY